MYTNTLWLTSNPYLLLLFICYTNNYSPLDSDKVLYNFYNNPTILFWSFLILYILYSPSYTCLSTSSILVSDCALVELYFYSKTSLLDPICSSALRDLYTNSY